MDGPTCCFPGKYWPAHYRRGRHVIPQEAIPALTVIIYPALLLRRRYPRAVFTLHWAYALAGVQLPEYVPAAGLLVALHAVGHRASLKWAWMALAACVAPFALNAHDAAATFDGENRALGFAWTLALWLALALTVWGSGRLICATEQRAIREQREQAAAVRAERSHLVRELHDVVSHSISAMMLQAAGARTLVFRDGREVDAALQAIETTGTDAMRELHQLLGLLRAAGPAEDLNDSSPPAQPLQKLDSLVSSARAAGIDVEVMVDGHPRGLDRNSGLAAYRTVQESLTNTIKHAGRGASSRIHLRWESDALTLTIRDHAGCRNQQPTHLSSGHGLNGLSERIRLVGGTLDAGPVADGFLVQARLPGRLPDQTPTSLTTSSKDTQ